MSLVESGNEGTFFIEMEGERAVLDFLKKGKEVHAIHTYTPSKFRGKGLAAKLVEALIAYSKERELKIYPSCSYVVSYFAKRPELNDVLSDDYPLEKRA